MTEPRLDWLRLIDVIEWAKARTGNVPRRDRGWSWACYCRVCCELRRIA